MKPITMDARLIEGRAMAFVDISHARQRGVAEGSTNAERK